MINFISVYTDGASRGNPGNSAIGIAVYDSENRPAAEFKKHIGTGTNNSAEYRALIESIEVIRNLKINFEQVNFFCDSELVVKQIRGEYRIRNHDMIKLSQEFFNSLKTLQKRYTITHITREKNKTADRLANEALDELSNNKAQE